LSDRGLILWTCIVSTIPNRTGLLHSPGLQSVSREQMDRRTLEMVRAGLQLSFRMSRQITP